MNREPSSQDCRKPRQVRSQHVSMDMGRNMLLLSSAHHDSTSRPDEDCPALGPIIPAQPKALPVKRPNLPPQGPPTPEPTFQVIEESILELWDVVNRLSEIPPPSCDRYRTTIFGSARLQPTDPLYQDVKHLASELTHMGCDIVTGGGPGLMQAANEGSVEADPHNQTDSIGLRVHLDFEQNANPFVEQLFTHRTFFSRLHHFVRLSNAFVVVPGGVGTLLEMTLVWQLLQVRQLYDKPLILVGRMWRDLIDWADGAMLSSQPQMASPADMKIPMCVDSMDEAIVALKTAKSVWAHQCALPTTPSIPRGKTGSNTVPDSE